jgi:hypothetical protein
MSCFLFNTDEESSRKINIDDLYEKQQRRDIRQLTIFNKILARVQKRITVTSRSKNNETHIWFNVPEYIFGEPIYDKGDCTGYLVAKLEENGFHVRYMHPNTLFVSWKNWVPAYVRNEIKKKTGIILDEKGNIIEKTEEEKKEEDAKAVAEKKGNGKTFTPIGKYKPTGNLVYNPEMIEDIEKKVSFS